MIMDRFKLGLLLGSVAVILIVLPYYYLPKDAYILKPNPAMGYFLPKYPEAWVLLIIALSLLGLSFGCIISYIRRPEK